MSENIRIKCGSEIRDRKKQGERGVALLLAVFALLIVTSVALGMMYLSDSETSVNANFRDEQTAYYAAKAGLEEARDRMRWNAGSGITINSSLPTAKPGAAGGALYILNPTGSETVAPWTTTNAYFDDEICKEVSCGGGQVPPTSGWYSSVNSNSTYAASPVLSYKWMRITLKTNQSAAGTANVMYVNGSSASASSNYYVCWYPNHEFASSTACALPNKPVYLLTTLAVTKSGTRRILQYEMTSDTLNLTFPGALTMDGTGDVMSGPNSNPYNVQGSDTSGCGETATANSTAAVAVNDAADQATVVAGIPTNRWPNYTGSGGTTPDVVATTMPASYQSVSSLQALVAQVEANANQTLNGTVTPVTSIPNASTVQITVVNGDLSLSGNVTGNGLLLVTGTYSACGNVGWNGMVLVIGKGIVTGCGGGNNQYTGAMLVAQTLNPSTGALLSSVGVPTFNWSGGGGNGIYYSLGCINQASYLADFQIVASRELLY